MVSFTLQQTLLSLALLSTITTAHPGHGGLNHEIAERAAYFKHNPRDLNHCADKLRARGINDRTLARRMAKVEDLQDKLRMKKRSLQARQTASASVSGTPLSSGSGSMPSGGPGNGSTGQTANLTDFGLSVVNTSHLSTLSVTPNTTDVDTLIFANSSCILNPESVVGPYYVSGELVRSDVTESQPGVPLYMDQQYIDINTCEPVELYTEIWHCNATGVYGGVVANGNGNTNDTSNLDATFLRGIQKSDSLGIVHWETVFPGYYEGRTTHIHMLTHTGASELSNGTISGGNVTHVGQLMFDQSLVDAINADVYPYTTNTQTMTMNDEDSIFIAEAVDGADPVVDYVLLGEDYEDGVFAWITIGVDPTAAYDASAAATLTESGGVENESQGMGSGPPS